MRKLIPTPLKLESQKIELPFSSWCWDGNFPVEGILKQAFICLENSLSKSARNERSSKKDELEIRFIMSEHGDCPLEIRQFLRKTPNAIEQGYALTIEPVSRENHNSIATIYAVAAQGAAYGILTLAQLCDYDKINNIWTIPAIRIMDRPDFRYRGITWGIFGEIGQWSYDWGDGIEAFRKRAFRALDIAFRYKLNMINIDGMGWNPERFPGYGILMRELTKAARERGIRLMFTGYGAGYGLGHRHDGPIFINRESYPDGKIYSCYDQTCIDPKAMTCGTCLSNLKLQQLKQANLREFVDAVEPGALYLHNMDWHSINKNIWGNRCSDCQDRWPNNDLYAQDGMAGAYAMFYDALAEAVFSVKHANSGYDAARDCVCVIVSPGYTEFHQTDEQWDIHVLYWTAVSRYMKHVRGVQFGIREQFNRNDGKCLRTTELADAISKNGQGHGLCTISFVGGDGFYNDLPYCGGPALNMMYEGAETVLQPCGHAFQEPMQLLSAEYAWRSRDSAFYNHKGGDKDDIHHLIELRDAYCRPPELFGTDGFLGEACRQLYGKEAGAIFAEIQRTFKDSQERITNGRDRNVDIKPCSAISFPENCHQWNAPFLRSFEGWFCAQWASNLPEATVRLRAKRLTELAWLDNKATELMENALQTMPSGTLEKELFATMRTGYRLCGKLANLQSAYFEIYADAQADITNSPGCITRLGQLRNALREFEQDVNNCLKNYDKPLDYLGGAYGNWSSTFKSIHREIEVFVASLQSGERGTVETVSWL